VKILQQSLLASALIAAAGNIKAEETRHDFDIAAQNLGPALQTLAAQSGASIFYASASVNGRKAKALKGQYSTPAALGQLLAGSKLTYSVAADGSISVKPAPSKLEPQSSTTLPTLTVIGSNETDATDPYNKDYAVFKGSSATKTDTPLMETPVNIQVIPKAVLDDQQTIQMTQALKNVAGATVSSGSGGLSDDIFLRGFRTSTYFRNGFRIDSQFASIGTRQMANVERLEVIKGPAAPIRPHGTRRHGQRRHQAAAGNALPCLAATIRLL